jgi:L-lactate dehydrogenase complex protein LldE
MRIALFVTCLVDLFRPSVGFASVKLLEKAGCDVKVPVNQTCCGQPAYNNGDLDDARDIARQVIESFRDYDYVVVPSGSCAGMIKLHYPELFKDDSDWYKQAQHLSDRCYEITQFLSNVAEVDLSQSTCTGTVTYHDSCSASRELKIKSEPRTLINQLGGVDLVEMADTQSCCGFGGTFCVKYPDISQHMVDEKVSNVLATQAQTLISADLGCLLNIAGRLKYLNKPVKVFHITELLASMTDEADIGGGQS